MSQLDCYWVALILLVGSVIAVDVPIVFDENVSELVGYDSNQLAKASALSGDLSGVPPVSSPDDDYAIEVTVSTDNSTNISSNDNITVESQRNRSGLAALGQSPIADETNMSHKIFETDLVPYFSLPVIVASSNPDYWIENGNQNYNDGNYQKAIECYDQAIKLYPRSKEAWCNKGIALCKQGKYKDAINAFDQAIHIDPDYLNARKNKDLTLKTMEREEDDK